MTDPIDDLRKQWKDTLAVARSLAGDDIGSTGYAVISKSPTDEEAIFLEASAHLANAKKAFSTDVLRRIAAGSRSYDAQHAAEVALGRDVALAEAEYQIALVHLKDQS